MGDLIGLDLGNVGEWSKPFTKLVETVDKCIAVWRDPMYTKRMAKAEAGAALVLAQADVERLELYHRTAERLVTVEVQRQQNFEKIVEMASEELPESVSEEPVDPDWTSRFFDDCKDVSNEDLQRLWARLLAGEVTAPGTYSRKTLSVLKDLNTADANLFRFLCSVVLMMGRGTPFMLSATPYMTGVYALYEAMGLQYGRILHLHGLGLIAGSSPIGIAITGTDTIRLGPWEYIVEAGHDECLLKGYPLTRAGEELRRVTRPEYQQQHLTILLEELEHGYPMTIIPVPDHAGLES